MSRTPRKKGLSNIHHIMSRSISELQLFVDFKDKDKFLNIIRKYQKIYMFTIYSYVLMDTHYHLQVNDNGADISKFMKSINQSYAQYYNKKYSRHGHLFSDRFKSKPIEKDSYVVTASAYIHNNPKDIPSYKNCVHKYKYSSLKVYAGIPSKYSDILDIDFILKYFNTNKRLARKSYLDFVCKFTDLKTKEELEFNSSENFYTPMKHILVRNFKPTDIIDFVSHYNKESFCVHAKYNHKNIESKSICVFLMRSLCDFKFSDISKTIGNLTYSNVGRLCEKGISLINTSEKYRNIVNDFINYSRSA